MVSRGKKAFAFSFSMWIIASLLFATVIILRFAKEEVKLSTALKDKTESNLIASNILEFLKFYVPTANSEYITLENSLLEGKTPYKFPSQLRVDGREYNLSKSISLSVKDTSGLENVMYSSASLISKLLSSDRTTQAILKDSLKDWRDEDNIARVNGAEQNSYEKVVVRDNGAIQDVDELQTINGFNQLPLDRIKEYLYYGRGSGLNMLLIENKSYLALLLNISEEEAQNLLEIKKESIKRFRKALEQIEGYNDEYMGFYMSKQFLVNIVAVKGEAMSSISTIISFKQLSNRPYMTIEYRSQ